MTSDEEVVSDEEPPRLRLAAQPPLLNQEGNRLFPLSTDYGLLNTER